MIESIREAYDRFADLHGTERPVWSRDELATWLHENGYSYRDTGTHLEGSRPQERRYVDDAALSAAVDVEMAESAS